MRLSSTTTTRGGDRISLSVVPEPSATSSSEHETDQDGAWLDSTTRG